MKHLWIYITGLFILLAIVFLVLFTSYFAFGPQVVHTSGTTIEEGIHIERGTNQGTQLTDVLEREIDPDASEEEILAVLRETAREYVGNLSDVREFDVLEVTFVDTNQNNERVYAIQYVFRPANPKTFVVAGGMQELEDGLYGNTLKGTVNENGVLSISGESLF